MLIPCSAHFLLPRVASYTRILRPVTESRYSSSLSLTSSHSSHFEYSVDLEESYYNQILYKDYQDSATDASSKNIIKMARFELEELLGHPRQPNEHRFQWDPWFVRCDQGRHDQLAPLPGDFPEWKPIPGERDAAAQQVQYSMTRAPCQAVFSEGVYSKLMDYILELGQSIGCTAITPPWISLYGDGQMQNFHTDPKQGTMAWTLSLSTGYGTTFRGGETVLMSPMVLDYWRDFDGSRGKEAPSLVRFLPPIFGRLTAFDPRIPHMVQTVSAKGVGPLDARIMIHGWYSEPEVIWYGDGLEENDEAESILNTCLEVLMETLNSGEIGRVMGFLSVRLVISPKGEVTSILAVCDTIREDPADSSGVVGYDQEGREVVEDSTADIRLTIREALGDLQFPETPSGGYVIVPFDFV
jgi:hypothetical protein